MQKEFRASPAGCARGFDRATSARIQARDRLIRAEKDELPARSWIGNAKLSASDNLIYWESLLLAMDRLIVARHRPGQLVP